MSLFSQVGGAGGCAEVPPRGRAHGSLWFHVRPCPSNAVSVFVKVRLGLLLTLIFQLVRTHAGDRALRTGLPQSSARRLDPQASLQEKQQSLTVQGRLCLGLKLGPVTYLANGSVSMSVQ